MDYWNIVQERKDCYCGDELMCFSPVNLTFAGQKFNCDLLDSLRNFKLLDSQTRDMKFDNTIFDHYSSSNWTPTFVTAASENHFLELRHLVHNIQENTKYGKIVFYDLGLSDKSVEELKTWCNVEYHKFPFEEYPDHVRNLKNFAWKMLLIADYLNKSPDFFYFDTSVMIAEGGDITVFPQTVISGEVDSYVLFSNVGHSVYSATYPGLLSYLPISKRMAQKTEMFQATINYVVDHWFTRQIFKWAVLCALTKECIDPEDTSTSCQFSEDRYNTSGNCHRYDQSVINIIVNNLRHRDFYEKKIFDTLSPTHPMKLFGHKLKVSRGNEYNGKLNTCT
ncbi:hypothetical protein Ddc_13792 [Ditylenchus destructor]|nr:hypothetical protein Ddc_13792 [Ditylenchus destructor]